MNTFKILSMMLIAAATMSCGGNQPGGGDNPGGETKTSDVQTYVTTGDNTMHFDLVGRDFQEGTNMNFETTIYLKPQTQYQEFDGFGVALNGSACYNLMKMTKENREKLLRETFDPNTGMGYSYTRISIGASDFSLSDYTCCDQPGIENFALTSEETTYIIPILKEVLAINPQLKVMGSPWTCPRWMKVNDLSTKSAYNSWKGGQLNPDYYQDYATYFVKWIKAFEAEGIHIESVTVQNEPLNRGNSASLFMGWQECRDFVKTALGPAFETAGLTTKILVFDHNYNYDNLSDQQQYPLKIYGDALAAKYIDGAAYHNYGGSPTELDNIHKQAPYKNLYFTEHSIGTWNYQNFQDALMNDMRDVGMATITRWCKSVIVWNYMLDQERGPYRPGGCGTCYGLVEINNRDYTTLNRRATYFVIGHLAKALKPGSKRIDVKGYSTNLNIAAAENPDGTYGLVLQNMNDQGITITVDDGTHHFDVVMPAKSLTSCVWKKE